MKKTKCSRKDQAMHDVMFLAGLTSKKTVFLLA